MTAIKSEAGPALLSPDGLYRYTLHRRWDEAKPTVNFIMLNPSTADAAKLDPTLRRCLGFADSWGYGGFVITNLFAYRATNRLVLRTVEDPIGPDNDAHLLEQAQQSDIVVCGWGTDGRLRNRDASVLLMLLKNKIAVHYLRLTVEGRPGHPLYLPSNLTPQPWSH